MTQGFSGVGLISSHARTGGVKGIGYHWGNCPKFELAPTPNAIERNSSMETSRSPLRRMTQTTALAVTIATDEFNKKNVALATQGRVDEVVADAVTTINKTFATGAVVGDILPADHLNITDAVVTDSTGSPKTLVLNVNYTLDAFSGHVSLIDVTTGGPYVQPFKLAHKKGAVSIVSGLAVAAPELWIAGALTNVDDGQRGTLVLVPHDRYDNPLGPGRGDCFTVTPLRSHSKWMSLTPLWNAERIAESTNATIGPSAWPCASCAPGDTELAVTSPPSKS